MKNNKGEIMRLSKSACMPCSTEVLVIVTGVDIICNASERFDYFGTRPWSPLSTQDARERG
jgi:hypothetical protein